MNCAWAAQSMCHMQGAPHVAFKLKQIHSRPFLPPKKQIRDVAILLTSSLWRNRRLIAISLGDFLQIGRFVFFRQSWWLISWAAQADDNFVFKFLSIVVFDKRSSLQDKIADSFIGIGKIAIEHKFRSVPSSTSITTESHFLVLVCVAGLVHLRKYLKNWGPCIMMIQPRKVASVRYKFGSLSDLKSGKK